MTNESITILHYGWMSIFPIAVTIVLSLTTKRVIESLLAGIALITVVLDSQANSFVHSILYLIPNTFSAIAGHAAVAPLKGVGLAKDPGRGLLLMSIILLGSFVSILDKSGGAYDFAERITKKIKTETGALLTAMVIGLSVFTSAYFSILILGTMMRPIFDQMKISREKLAFYCDGMSAPTKAFLPFSGWIAFMVVLIEQNIPEAKALGGVQAFMKTMPFNFYCIGTMLFILLLSLGLLPDFGPMKKAELRVKKQDLIHLPGSKPMIDPKIEESSRQEMRKGSMWDMFIPLLVSVLALFILGMWDSFLAGWFPALPKIGIKSLEVMNVAFTLGILTALIKYVSKKLMTFSEYMDLAIEGGKSALIGAFIIVLAITLGDLMQAQAPEGLGTAAFLVETLTPLIVASWIPAITFLVSAIMSFATGTSWGTWAIMMPVSVPLAISFGMNPFLVVAAVLSGGTFGDHCGPISDTTVLSSIASNTDHIQHVKTQIPYALTVASFAFVGYVLLGMWMA